MKIADGFLLEAKGTEIGATPAPAPHPLLIQPWISSPADIVVYEFGARLDENCEAAAAEQILKARCLYNAVIRCIRAVHGEMNAWVLERAGPRAKALQDQLSACELEIAAAKAAADIERLHILAPQRIALGTELTGLLRPTREKYRAEIRSLFFSRVGNTTTTETYQLRCQAVNDGLGWATATAVLDSALLAWKKSLALGRAPKFASGDRKDQDALILQFTAKDGPPVDRIMDGTNLEIHLSPPPVARRRAYGQFRFRLGLARDNVNATGTWQYHRPLPEGAHVSGARLVRRRVADKERWSLQLVLRLVRPIELEPAPIADLAAVHFGWLKGPEGRRVATIARSADAAVAESIVLPASIEEDLARYAVLQGQRARARDALIPQLEALMPACAGLPSPVPGHLATIAMLSSNHVATRRIYRLQAELADFGIRRGWLDAWVREDRMRWQAAVLLARRARGRRRDFYRRTALQLARDHGAVVLEPLDLRAASKAFDASGGQWSAFSHHARAGRVVVALHEFEQAIRWACVRHGTPVFDLKGMTSRSCASCGAMGLAIPQDAKQRVRCIHCGAEHDRHANAACCAWRWTHENLNDLLTAYRTESVDRAQQTNARIEARKKAIAEKRRTTEATRLKEHNESG
jgi:hypothetical protein